MKAAANPATPFDALVEEIDIGGPSLVRAAAKNFRDVLVVVDPADYPRLLAALDAGAEPGVPLRADAQGVRAHGGVRHRDRRDARRRSRSHGDAFERRALAERSALASRSMDWRSRRSATCATARTRISARPGTGDRHRRRRRPRRAPTILQGKELSYTNLLDLDAAARIVLEFDEPAAVVIKHTNPCGAATGDVGGRRVRARARRRRLAAFGGIVGLNRPIDVATAEAIVSTFIEAVIAPAVDEAARADPRAQGRTCASSTADFAALAARRRSSSDRFSARCSRRSATASVEARQAVERRRAARGPARRDEARSRRRRSGRRCASRGASART